ncbi:MAG: hypothetical protein HRU12_03150 [Phaeodactylibacter sp.]|nr:hypothetical protein [Phaeodactylibacter sp.]
MNNIPSTWLAAIILMVATGCFPENFDVAEPEDWNPAFGVPLINTSFSINDLLDDLDDGSLIQTDIANRLTVVYQDRIEVDPEFEIEPIPNIPIPIVDKEQTVQYQAPDDYQYEIIRLKAGVFQYTVLNPFMDSVNFSLSFANLKLGDDSLAISRLLPAADIDGPSETSGIIDISGYELLLNEDIRTVYTANLFADNTPVDLPPFLVNIGQMDYSYIQGYFGRFEVTLPGDSLEFDFLDNWEAGELEFLEPVINLTFFNTMGIPLELRSDTFELATFRNGIVALNNPMLNSGLLFAFPSIDEVGEAKSTLLSLNSENSNIVSAISGVPYQLNYAFSAIANPNENNLITNHLTDTVKVDIDIEVEIPLFARAKGFRIVDTFEVDLSDLEDLERLGFKLIADNGFPLEVGMQLQFMDEDGMVFDSLFQDGSRLVESGNRAMDGTVTSAKETTLDSELNGDQLAQIISRTVDARIIATLESPNGGTESARMLDTYTLGVRLGILAGF